MKKIPSSIVIFGERWKIRRVKEIEGGYDGLCKPKEREILIRIGKHKDEVHTFFHEIMHAMSFRLGFCQMPEWSLNVEELFCENVATFLSENFNIETKRGR